MNILDRLANEAKKKRDDLLNRKPTPAPVQAPRPTQFSPLAQSRILARDPSGGQAKINRGPVLPKPVGPPRRENILQKTAGGFREGAPTLGLAAKRVGIGIGQDFSGAVDLVSKGTGTSRVSKYLDKQAINTDREAARRNVTASYQQTQVPLALSAFATPGLGYAGAAAKTAKVASNMPKVMKVVNTANKAGQAVAKTKVAKKVAAPVVRTMNKLDNGNLAQRVTGTAIRGGLRPASLVNTGAGTIFDLGSESGKGRDISKRDVATSIAMNAGASAALPAIGQVGREAVTGAVPAAKKAANNVRVAQQKMNGYESLKGDAARTQSGIAILKQRQAANPDPIAYEQYWRKITNKEAELGQIRQQLQTSRPSTTTRLIGAQPGLSMRAVHSPDLSPEQNNFIEEYATMLKDMGQGNGVDITPDGRRISNNVRDADVKGKALNNSYWFDKARQEIESGKAAYGASDEYKAIAAPSTKPAPQSPPTAGAAQPPAGRGTGEVSSLENNPDFAKSKFPKRLMEDDRTIPLERTLEGNAYHEVKHNKDTLEATAKAIVADEDKALALAKRGTSTEANATSLQLLEKYLGEGNMEKADDLLQAVLPRFTRQGQQTQILAAYSKMTPVGAVKYAQQQLNKAAAKSGRGERVDIETDQLHKAIEQSNRTATKVIESELRQGKLGAPKTPEQMLADRIKSTNDGRKPTNADPIRDMVNTLHKVAKEVLPEQGKKAPRDPMELVGAAIRDKQLYGDTYDRAKAIVMDKYRDNPEALAELEKYFNTDAAATYANSQINKGIQNGLKGTDLGKLVREHYTKVDETGADLKAKLIKQAGLSEAEAGQLAADIQQRFSDLTNNKKQQILEQMFKVKNKPEQKDAVTKILELSNLGAFSKDELRGAVATKLGAPTLPKEAASTIAQLADGIQRLPEGSPERNRAAAEMMQFIQKQVLSSMTDKVMGAWTAGLISGGKTITGAPLSNVTNALTRTTVSPIAAGLDFARTAGGTIAPRSNTLVSPMNYVRGFREGLPKAKEYFKTGIDERAPVGTDYPEINYKHESIGKLVNGVFRLMGALDRPFYYGQKALSQAEMTKLQKLNKGKQFNQKTPEELAEADARISVLDFDTVLSKIGTAVKQAMDKNDDAFSRGAGKIAAQLNAPFVRIPSAGLARMVDFSPMGAPVNIARQLSNMKWGAQKGVDWRSLNTAIAESATGTGIGLVLGYKLAENNLVTGAYPSGDQKEAKRWEAEGIQPNSIKINGTWVSMNYLGPFGSLLQQGRRFQESQAEGNNFAQSAATSQGGVVRDALNQSYLQGLNSSLEAARDPQRAMQGKVNGIAGTVIPAAINDVSVATDKMQREAKTPFESIVSRTPFRQNLREKQDVYGNSLERKTGAIGSAVNPLRPSDDKSQKNPVVAEVSRLKNADRTNKELQVTPTPVDKKLKIENQTVKLTDKQRYDLQKQVGQATQKAWGDLIKTEDYKALDDVGKAKALSDLRTDVAGATQRQYVVNNNLATYSKEMSKKQQAVLDGDSDLANYTDTTGTKAKAETYAEKYQNALKEQKKDSAKWTVVEKSKKTKEIKKLSVQKDYDNDTVSLYSMGKADVYDIVSKDKNGKGMVDKLIAYGDALEAAGLEDNKWRDSKGNIAVRPKAKSTGGSGRGGANPYGLKPSDFVTPYTNLIKSSTTGASLARSAGLAKKKA